MSGCGKFSPGDGERIQIGTGEHGVKPILVFHQSTIHRFLIAELTLDNPERVLNFAAHRGFAVLNITLPVDCVVRYMRQLSGTAVNAVVNTG